MWSRLTTSSDPLLLTITGAGWFTLATLCGVLVAILRLKLPHDLVLLGAVTLLAATGVITPQEAFSGFADPVTLAIAALLVVAVAIRETGGTEVLAGRMLGTKTASTHGALLRLLVPTSLLSAFMNNTPLVAMLIPTVRDWAKRIGRSPATFLMPLSFVSILGGLCSLIGTSTNLVVAGLARRLDPPLELSLFSPTFVGIPCLIVGIIYLIYVAPRLPERGGTRKTFGAPREFLVTMEITSGSTLAGQSIEAGGLRRLDGLYLIEVQRDEQTLVAVAPDLHLREGDRLVFAGLVDCVIDLMRRPGLRVATNQIDKLESRLGRRFFEAVVGSQSTLINQSIRGARFRTHFGAAVLAVHRQGVRVEKQLGDIELRAGDTLLLEASANFRDARRNDGTFALISELDGLGTPQRRQARYAWVVLASLVCAVSLGASLPLASIGAAIALIALKVLPLDLARRSIDLGVVISIASAFGLAQALNASGLAAAVAAFTYLLFPVLGGFALLLLTFTATSALSLMLTNTAAAALMFPISLALASNMGSPAEPIVLSVMFGASASFASPLGYQTNLMVLGPGAYTFGDFFRVGFPLQVIVGLLSSTILYMAYFT